MPAQSSGIILELGKNYRLDEDGELEKMCTRCKEYWPADTEFFYKSGDGLHTWCKACVQDWKHERIRTGITDQRGRVIRKASV